MPCFAFPNGDIYGNAYATDCYWRCAFAITEIAAPNKSLNRTASTWRKRGGIGVVDYSGGTARPVSSDVRSRLSNIASGAAIYRKEGNEPHNHQPQNGRPLPQPYRLAGDVLGVSRTDGVREMWQVGPNKALNRTASTWRKEGGRQVRILWGYRAAG